MESFFGRMKCEILDLVALCPDADTVKRMIDGYMNSYNNEHYQYALAGLTPAEYYTYVTTGIYPLDNYYGIPSTELMPIGVLVKARLCAAAEKAGKVREANAKRRAAKPTPDRTAEMIVARDQEVLRREISKLNRSREFAARSSRAWKMLLRKQDRPLLFLNLPRSSF